MESYMLNFLSAHGVTVQLQVCMERGMGMEAVLNTARDLERALGCKYLFASAMQEQVIRGSEA